MIDPTPLKTDAQHEKKHKPPILTKGDKMTNNPRQTRTDTTANLHRVLAGANIELAPPCHVPLDDAAWPFWHSLVEEFAKADFTPHMLDLTAILARTMAQLDAQQRAQRNEGSVITKANGYPGPNPRNRVVSTLLGQVLSLRRSLALTGRAKAGRSEEATWQRVQNRRVEQGLRGNHDNLLS